MTCVVDDHINALKVVGSLDHIINLDHPVGHTDGVRLEDVARLIVGEATAFNMIGVVGQVDLDLMINAAVQLRRLLGFQNL